MESRHNVSVDVDMRIFFVVYPLLQVYPVLVSHRGVVYLNLTPLYFWGPIHISGMAEARLVTFCS